MTPPATATAKHTRVKRGPTEKGWTVKQRSTHGIAAKAAGLDKDARKLVLAQFDGAMHRGEITSKSPKLTNTDFEFFMAICERSAGGQLPTYRRHHWQDQAGKHLSRMSRKAEHLAAQMRDAGILHAEYGLEGFIKRQTMSSETGPKSTLAACEWRELYNVIEGLKKFARNRGLRLT